MRPLSEREIIEKLINSNLLNMLSMLKESIETDPDTIYKKHAICKNINLMLYDLYDHLSYKDIAQIGSMHISALNRAILSWPEIHTDNSDGLYPVGGRLEFQKEGSDGTLWLNPRRLALLDWLLSQFIERDKSETDN